MGTRIDALPSQRFIRHQTVPGIVEPEHFQRVNSFEPRSRAGVLQTDDKRRRSVGMVYAFEQTEEKGRSPKTAVVQPVNEPQEIILSIDVGAFRDDTGQRFAQ